MTVSPLTGAVQKIRSLGNIFPAADIDRTALIKAFWYNIEDRYFTICSGAPGLLDQ